MTPDTSRIHVGATRLVLFDVDGTLLLSGGAGKRALNRAFEEVFGATDAFAGIPVAGRTDTLIVDDALYRAGVAADQPMRRHFFARYCEYLKEEILYPGPKKGLLPGVELLLEQLASHSELVSALLTGNFAAAAQIKLGYFGIWRYFTCGAYGDDAPVREDLLPIALARAREAGIPIVSTTDVVVVGDTPLDVQCAAAAGARSIAVATGSFNEEALWQAGADVVLSDLSDSSLFLAAIVEPCT